MPCIGRRPRRAPGPGAGHSDRGERGRVLLGAGPHQGRGRPCWLRFCVEGGTGGIHSGRPRPATYDAFVYFWTAAVAGRFPNGTSVCHSSSAASAQHGPTHHPIHTARCQRGRHTPMQPRGVSVGRSLGMRGAVTATCNAGVRGRQRRWLRVAGRGVLVRQAVGPHRGAPAVFEHVGRPRGADVTEREAVGWLRRETARCIPLSPSLDISRGFAVPLPAVPGCGTLGCPRPQRRLPGGSTSTGPTCGRRTCPRIWATSRVRRAPCGCAPPPCDGCGHGWTVVACLAAAVCSPGRWEDPWCPRVCSQVSPDVWVRVTADTVVGTRPTGFVYAHEHEHQDPVYAGAVAPNYVYVAIRNRGCRRSTGGTISLYWAKASTGLAWDASWINDVASGSTTRLGFRFPHLCGPIVDAISFCFPAARGRQEAAPSPALCWFTSHDWWLSPGWFACGDGSVTRGGRFGVRRPVRDEVPAAGDRRWGAVRAAVVVGAAQGGASAPPPCGRAVPGPASVCAPANVSCCLRFCFYLGWRCC